VIPPLKPAGAGPVPCRICGQPSPLFGVVDSSRSCEDARLHEPLTGVAVYYRRCTACGFLFSDAFDGWSQADFKAHIYNADYVRFDPDYVERRPKMLAETILHFFGRDKEKLRVLDYGGGNGLLAASLRAAGFVGAAAYDPFTPEFAALPDGKFDLVTCFETLEHVPEPLAAIDAIIARAADPGVVLFSTLLQPEDFDRQGMGWWYVAPRNGHISLFSRPALEMAWRRHGYMLGSFDDNMHVAFRSLPEFASHLANGS
jgi:2-polyprenyl-6-hydroxyphenyl methylase/3-demethylubiquinone-9 3-methyltransferase